MYHIRSFFREDIDTCIELARDMVTESSYRDIPFHEAKMRSTFNYILYNPTQAFCFVACDDNNKVVGGILGYISEYIFSFEKVVSDYVLFLHPSVRGTLCAARLVKEYTRWATEHGAMKAVLGITSEVEEERTGRLYEALGYRRCGAIYSRRV